MPEESAFVGAVRGGRWTQTHELLAWLIEVTSAGQQLAYVAAGGKEEWPTIKVPRPGVPEPEPEKPQFADVHELKAFMMRTGR